MDSQTKKKHNKLIVMFVIFLVILLFNSIKVSATEGDTIATGTTGSCTYTITELADGNYSLTISGSGAMKSYTVSNYTSSGWYTYRTNIEEVIIEDGVTSIGNYSFYKYYTALTTVDLSNCTTLTSIGTYAFYYCSALASIDLSNCTSLTSINSYAFNNCTSLTSIEFPTSLTSVGTYAFYYCTSLASLDLSNCTSLTSIETYAFYYCSALASIDLSNCTSLTSISSYVFSRCTSLTSIEFPTSLTSVGTYAFYYCTSLTSIKLPDSLTSIGSSAFRYCTSLTEIDLSNCTGLTQVNGFYSCTLLTDVKLPNSITSIGSSAFEYCTSLTEIDLSNYTNLTSIGGYAFYGCTSLTNVNFPISLTTIGYYSFAYCVSLDEINLNDCTQLNYIGSGAFYYCTSLTEVDLSNCTNLSYIYSESFYQCTELSNLFLPKSIICIYGHAFSYCESLENLDLSDFANLQYIGEFAFGDCTSLKSVNLSNCTALTEIQDGAFERCFSLKEVNFERCKSLYGIDYCAFYGCESLEEIDLTDCYMLNYIGGCAFGDCESLTTVTLFQGIETIYYGAFYYCSNLTNINLSELTYLTTIDYMAFYYCTSLTSIELGQSVETIGDYAFSNTALVNIDLSNCTSLTYIGEDAFFTWHSKTSEEITLNLPKDTEIYMSYAALFDTYVSDWNWLYSYSWDYYVDLNGVAWGYYSDSNEAYVAFVPSGIETYEVPSTVTISEVEYDVIGICDLSFTYASDLTEITFEDISKITWLDTYAFAYCEKLEAINGYSTLTEIEESFENVTLSETMVEATKISTLYDLNVYIDLYDYSEEMEELLKEEIDVEDLTEITLQLYCNGEIKEEETISLEDSYYIYYTFEDLSIENEYYVDIAHDNSRWGANILYGYAGNTTPAYAWINIGTKYAYTVTMNIDELNSVGEISSIEVNLLDEEGNIVDTAKFSEDNNWSYVFYIGYANNRYNALRYISENYTLEVVENDDYDYSVEIDYEDLLEFIYWDTSYAYPQEVSVSSTSSSDSCFCYTYLSYSYTPGATITLTYSEYSDVIVHHYIYDDYADDPYTETQVPSSKGETVADETLTGIVGEEYKTNASSDIAYNYEYITDSENTSGTYTSEEIEVIYYYKLKDADVESNITKTEVVNDGTEEGSTSITEKDQTITYTISYNASIDEYIGDGTITVVDELPYEIEDDYTYTITINGEESDITAVYDSEEQTLTWEIPAQDINTYDENGNSTANEISIEIVLTVEYKDLDYMETSITNNVTGTLYLDATKQEVSKDSSLTVEQKYEISIPVEKVWVDSDDINEQRPESVTIELKVKTIEEAEDSEETTEEDTEDSDDDTATAETEESDDSEEENVTYEVAYDYDGNEVESIVLNEDNDWSGVFENLPKYDSEGNEIEYAVVETETNEYDLEHYKDAIITYGSEYVEIRNVYKYLETDLEAQITKTATPEITSTEDTVVYTIEYTATIKNYIGDAVLVVTDVLPYDIDEELSDLGDGVYDSNTHTITWTIEIEHINTDENGDYEVSFEREFSVVYGENIDLSVNTIDADVEATIYLTDTSEANTVEDDAETIITIPGKVIVKYVDQDTGEELTYIDEETEEETTYGYEIDGYTGEEYTTEQKEIDGYTFAEATDNTEGIINQEEVEVIYYYTQTPATVYVTYVDEDGNEIADDETIEGYVNDEYTTEQKDIYGYTFVESTENTTGTMTDEEIEVIYYYTKTSTTVHVTYVDEDGNEIADDETIEGYVNDEYETEEKEIKYYTLIETPENAEGVMTDETIEVVYQYEQTSGVVYVTYVDEDGNEIADSETIEDLIDSEYTTEQKDIYGYTFVESTENTEGTITKEAIEVIYYYTKTETSVHVTYVDQSTNEEIADDETIEGYVGDDYETEQKEITYYTFVKSTNNTTGEMEEDVIEVIYYYRSSTFNMSIDKKISSITKNGTTTTKNSTLEKVEVGRNDVSSTSITVKYTITVTNTGDLAGTATVADYLPDYFTLSSANPSYWTDTTKGYITTDVTLEAGESTELTVILDWTQGESNFGTTTNTAMIIETSNDANFEETSTDDNESSVNVVLSVRTGWDTVKEISPWVLLAMCGVALILMGLKEKQKAKVIKNNKENKN